MAFPGWVREDRKQEHEPVVGGVTFPEPRPRPRPEKEEARVAGEETAAARPALASHDNEGLTPRAEHLLLRRGPPRARRAGRLHPPQPAGWHSADTCSPFGAAAAACALLGLDTQQTSHALALTASFSAGIWAFVHDGATSKRLLAGRAAEAGLSAALLAANGFTRPSRVFSDVWGGFLHTLAPSSVAPTVLTADLGRQWRISLCSIKPDVSCRSTHSSIDAVSSILTTHGLADDDIALIHIRLSGFVHDMCGGTGVESLTAASSARSPHA
ncbi:MmgE/PrpD family protein [Streptomyces lydicus]|uniref:MmgE/PrpD family protein n=1 Tax=Streptomyces lydicus TaxID=47763 RepID=UPI0036E3F481